MIKALIKYTLRIFHVTITQVSQTILALNGVIIQHILNLDTSCQRARRPAMARELVTRALGSACDDDLSLATFEYHLKNKEDFDR